MPPNRSCWKRWNWQPSGRRDRLSSCSAGQALTITVPNLKTAAKLGRYLSAVRQFLATNDPGHLAPHIGESVTDTAGKTFPFETNPNVLYRLSVTGTETFEQVYRIAV